MHSLACYVWHGNLRTFCSYRQMQQWSTNMSTGESGKPIPSFPPDRILLLFCTFSEPVCPVLAYTGGCLDNQKTLLTISVHTRSNIEYRHVFRLVLLCGAKACCHRPVSKANILSQLLKGSEVSITQYAYLIAVRHLERKHDRASSHCMRL